MKGLSACAVVVYQIASCSLWFLGASGQSVIDSSVCVLNQSLTELQAEGTLTCFNLAPFCNDARHGAYIENACPQICTFCRSTTQSTTFARITTDGGDSGISSTAVIIIMGVAVVLFAVMGYASYVVINKCGESDISRAGSRNHSRTSSSRKSRRKQEFDGEWDDEMWSADNTVPVMPHHLTSRLAPQLSLPQHQIDPTNYRSTLQRPPRRSNGSAQSGTLYSQPRGLAAGTNHGSYVAPHALWTASDLGLDDGPRPIPPARPSLMLKRSYGVHEMSEAVDTLRRTPNRVMPLSGATMQATDVDMKSPPMSPQMSPPMSPLAKVAPRASIPSVSANLDEKPRNFEITVVAKDGNAFQPSNDFAGRVVYDWFDKLTPGEIWEKEQQQYKVDAVEGDGEYHNIGENHQLLDEVNT